MCNFEDAVPTGSYAISTGTSVVLGLERPFGLSNQNIGSGTVTNLSSSAFAANGSYDYDIAGYSGSGTWTIDAKVVSGDTWSLDAQFTGTNKGNKSCSQMACAESGSGEDTTIVYTGCGYTITQSYQNDHWYEKAKLFFGGLAIPDIGTLQVYFYNSAYDAQALTKTGDLVGRNGIEYHEATSFNLTPYQNPNLGISQVELRLNGANAFGTLEDPDAEVMTMVQNAFAYRQTVSFVLKPDSDRIQLISIG